jgi:hypothetical protein
MFSALVSTISYSLILILRSALPGCVAAAYECHNVTAQWRAAPDAAIANRCASARPLKQPGSARLLSLLSAKNDDCGNENKPASANHPDRTGAGEPYSATGEPSVECHHTCWCEEPPKAKPAKKRNCEHVTCRHDGYLPNAAHQWRAANDVQKETEAESARPLNALCFGVLSIGFLV